MGDTDNKQGHRHKTTSVSGKWLKESSCGVKGERITSGPYRQDLGQVFLRKDNATQIPWCELFLLCLFNQDW